MLSGGLPYYQSLGNEQLLSIVAHDYASEFQKLEPLLSFRYNRMLLMNWDPHLDIHCSPESSLRRTVVRR